jgi:hypothetical protein
MDSQTGTGLTGLGAVADPHRAIREHYDGLTGCAAEMGRNGFPFLLPLAGQP